MSTVLEKWDQALQEDHACLKKFMMIP